MKNIVSFETANRLKEAGFPQPELETGHFRYESSGTPYFAVGNNGEFSGIYLGGGVFNEIESQDIFVDIFAPTATDILEKLAEYHIAFNPLEDAWFVFEPPELTERLVTITMEDNPAEAAALAWLLIHEKDLHK